MSNLRDDLDKLAEHLCKKATQDATPIEASTDALKVAAAYYAICNRVDAKKGGGDEDEDSFTTFESAINGANKDTPNGRLPPASPGRRRN